MKFFNAAKHRRLSMLVVMIMLLQVIMPVVGDVVWAENVEEPVETEQPKNEQGELGEPTDPTDKEIPTESEDEEMPEEPVEPGNEVEEDTDNPEEKESLIDKVMGLFGDGEGKDLGNIFIFDYLKLGDKEIEDNQIIEIEDGTEVSIQFKWDTQGKNAEAGDWTSMELPDVFKDANVSNQPISVDGVTVGTYSIVGRELKLEFNKEIEKNDVKNGYVGLKLKFDIKKFKENIEQEIKFNDSKDTTLNVIAKPKDGVSGIDKEGHPDNNHDAKEITWTIDVLNLEEEKITDAVVKDNIPEGLKLKEGSFIVKELTVGYEGNKVEGSEVDVSPTTTGDNGFDFEFSSIAPYKGYRIEYTTIIEDYSKTSFTNDATLSYEEKKLPAKATVGSLTRSDSIEKDGSYKGYDATLGKDIIEWTLSINKSGSEIENAIVHDALPNGLDIKGPIKVYKNGQLVEEEFNSFPITLGKVESTDVYEIKFKTSIDYSKVNNGVYQEKNEFTNKVELKDGEESKGESKKTVSFNRYRIFKKLGQSNVSHENKTLTWSILVNEARHPINNAVVEDILPKGLSIIKDQIKVYKEGQKISLGDNDISISPQTDGTTKITIDLGDIGTEYYRIDYTTKIEDFEINKFENTASLKGEGVGDSGKMDSVPINPPANSFKKGFKSIDYNAKTIEWELKVNPIREAITELKIVDTFPNKGLILLSDTLEVRVGGTLITEGYTLTPNTKDGTEGYQKGFILDFGNITEESPLYNKEIKITYQTSYDPQLEVGGNVLDPHPGGEGANKVYKNKAQFIGKTKSEKEFNLPKEVNHEVREDSWNSGKKEGQLVHFDDEDKLVNDWISGKERKIAWQLYINYQKQNLGAGVSVTDTLAYEGAIDKNSVKVSVYEVDKDGKTKITTDVLERDKYDLKVNGKEFTLTFNEAVSERYVIEFTTTVPDISQEKYTNNAIVKVGEDEYPYTGTVNYNNYKKFLDKGALLEDKNVYTGEEIEWKVTVNESLSTIKQAKITDTISKGLVYVDGSLKVYKLVDGEEVLLEKDTDYTFDKSTNDAKETVLELDFKKDVDTIITLRYKTVVTEIKGQVNNKVELEGTGIENVEIESEELNASQFSWVGGEFDPKKGALRVKKVDAEDNEVIDNNEAEFTLEYELNGERVQFGEEFTNEKGVLEIGGLPLRTYYLKEVEAPNGYVLLEEEMEIVVDKAYGNDEKNIIKIDFKNTKEKVEVTGNKKWDGGPKPEIELQLYRNGVPLEGEEYKVKLKGTEETPWTHTWTNLDKTDIDGNEYEYTVDEVKVPENYGKLRTDDKLTVTNTYKSPKTEVTGRKVWEGGSKVKPEIELQLYRNGEKYLDPVKLEDGETEYTWKNLDRTDRDGKVYIYTIDEVKVPTNYRKSISADGLTITNTYRPPTPPYEPPTEDPYEPEPEDPDKPNEEEPKDPEKPEDPEPTDPEDPTIDVDEDGNPKGGTDVDKKDEDNPTIGLDGNTPKGGTNVNKTETLPKTGETNNIFFYFIGLILIALGFVFRRKRV